LALYRALLRPSRGTIGVTSSLPLLRLGCEYGAVPDASVLSAALVASATFVIVTVAVNGMMRPGPSRPGSQAMEDSG
jgi:hypothetical protein